jgi:hypothetical protein
MAEFMETFERVGIPDYLPHAFLFPVVRLLLKMQ